MTMCSSPSTSSRSSRHRQGGHLGRRQRHFVGFGEALDQDARRSRARALRRPAPGRRRRRGVVVEDVEPVPDGAPAERRAASATDHGLAVAGRRTDREEPPPAPAASLASTAGRMRARPMSGAAILAATNAGAPAIGRATVSLVDPPLAMPPIQEYSPGPERLLYQSDRSVSRRACHSWLTKRADVTLHHGRELAAASARPRRLSG